MAATPPKVQVRVVGQETINRKFRTMESRLQRIFQDIVNKHSRQIVNEAKRRVDVDMGRLRASIKQEFYQGGLTARVATNVGYGAFVEWGTGPLGRQTGKDAPLDYVYGSGGKFPPMDVLEEWVWRHRKNFGVTTRSQVRSIAFLVGRKISRHGLAARPFMLPAFEQQKPKYRRDVKRAFGNTANLV